MEDFGLDIAYLGKQIAAAARKGDLEVVEAYLKDVSIIVKLLAQELEKVEDYA